MPKGKHDKHVKGAEHYRWSGGKMFTEHGYVKIRVGCSHPLADPNGYAYEQLLVWVSAGNPRPRHNEILHHINGDTTDNRIENLALMKRDKHSSHHNAERGRDELGHFLPRRRLIPQALRLPPVR